MSSYTYDRTRASALKVKLSAVFLISIFIFLPTQSFANSRIASAVAAACAPNPTVPDVGSCSACHSTTNNRGPNDLTAAGQWSLSPSTYMNFCPNAAPPPAPAPAPTPVPPPTTPPGMSPAPPSTGMGMGSGGGDDDDDDEAEDDDDDGGNSASSSLRSRLRALRARFSSRN
ncbi:hypothetical protein [Kaarinaea lacus]